MPTDNVHPLPPAPFRVRPEDIRLPWVAPWPTFNEATTNLSRWCGELELEGFTVDRLDVDGSPRQPTWIVPTTPWPFRPSAGFALVSGEDMGCPSYGMWYRVVKHQGMVVAQHAEDLPVVRYSVDGWAGEELARVLHLHGYRPMWVKGFPQ